VRKVMDPDMYTSEFWRNRAATGSPELSALLERAGVADALDCASEACRRLATVATKTNTQGSFVDVLSLWSDLADPVTRRPPVGEFRTVSGASFIAVGFCRCRSGYRGDAQIPAMRLRQARSVSVWMDFDLDAERCPMHPAVDGSK
jgi:hypothetical protein